MAHNKIIDSVKKHGQVAIKDLDEFLPYFGKGTAKMVFLVR